MSNPQDPGLGIVAIAILGSLVSLAILFSIYRYFERQQDDPYFASQENLNFQEIVAVKSLRRQVAEEFVSRVINCAQPSLPPQPPLTEQQVNESVAAAFEDFSASEGTSRKCNTQSSYWTFERPCSIKINKSPFGLREAVKLGELVICRDSIARSLHSALDSCRSSLSPGRYLECLASSIVDNDEIKNEINKSVDIAR